jgi:hypothetical protein
MPENVLDNGSFEQGHYDEGNCQIPNDWLLKARDGEYTVTGPPELDENGDPIPGSEPDYYTSLPESRLTECALLPEGERELFCIDGDYCLKIFGGRKALHAWLFQEVSGLQVGAIYEFTVPLFVDTYLWDDGKVQPNLHPDEPRKRAARIRFTAADADREQHSVWHDEANVADWHLNKHVLTWGFEATAETMTVGFEVWNPWPVHNCGWFFDGLELVKAGEPEPEQRCVCPNNPYRRIYVVRVGNAPRELRQAIAIAVDNTTGPGVDDSAIGNYEDRHVVVINPQDIGTGLSKEWYDKHYPGLASYREIVSDSPWETAIKLLPPLGDKDIAQGQSWESWASEQFGEDPGASSIKQYGCFLTGLSIMLRNVYGRGVTPPILDDLLVAARVAYAQGNLLDWLSAVELFPVFGEAIKSQRQLDAAQLKALQDLGYEIILPLIDRSHFVYLEKVEGGKLHIIDTWDGERKVTEWINYSGVRAALVGETEPDEPEPPQTTGPQPPETDGPTVSFHVQAPESGL